MFIHSGNILVGLDSLVDGSVGRLHDASGLGYTMGICPSVIFDGARY